MVNNGGIRRSRVGRLSKPRAVQGRRLVDDRRKALQAKDDALRPARAGGQEPLGPLVQARRSLAAILFSLALRVARTTQQPTPRTQLTPRLPREVHPRPVAPSSARISLSRRRRSPLYVSSTQAAGYALCRAPYPSSNFIAASYIVAAHKITFLRWIPRSVRAHYKP
jgi:hypothetical protein